MVATPEDWDRFVFALLSGRLLPPAQLVQMRTTVEDLTSSGAVNIDDRHCQGEDSQQRCRWCLAALGLH